MASSVVLSHLNALYFVVASIAAAVAAAASVAASRPAHTKDEQQAKGVAAMFALAAWGVALAAVAVCFLSRVLGAALSRSREYLADHTAAELCGEPEQLASALRAIEGATQRSVEGAELANAHQYIVSPMPFSLDTHPSPSSRERRLLSLAGGRRKAGAMLVSLLLPILAGGGIAVAGIRLAAMSPMSMRLAADGSEITPAAYCGSDFGTPPEGATHWSAHVCMSRRDAGKTRWRDCLRQAQYTDEDDKGST